jgi:hypothetical protein
MMYNPPYLLWYKCKTTPPVALVQVGWVSVPTEGVLGLPAFAVTVIFAVGDDTQPATLVTL